ncbi:glycosyl hydrolase family 65 protein, partial [Clostridium perfringens]|nr:glycosyl hydrolase family 65 protein [Clostridium perfringens]
LFHLMQSAGRDGKTGMGAKGLSGEGYEGHYFWDTEMYVLPVFVYTKPDLAKKLLDYRYFTLDKARERARVLGHDKGALYPWRTINGEEASTYFPLGTAQYHINADIAYAFKLYVDINDDFDYLKDKAAEVLCETARVWADVGSFSEYVGNKYCICAVTGPDEYNAIVDNNFYTNLMARENLRDAIWALNKIKEKDQLAYDNLVKKIDLKDKEIEYWKKIIENMYFPYDEKRGVYPLDDGFMKRKPWDDSKIPKEKRHLLYENYHPLFIFRQRMSKQADAILAMYLHSNLFSIEELRKNYDFYQEVTLHHSSLSTCIFGILASQIGYDEEAYKYFSQSARMDLDDYHNNFYAGIHAANMAGTWQGIVNGFAGLRTNKGILELNPTIPKEWNAYSFKIFYKKNLLEIKISKDEIEIRLLEGENLELYVYGEKVYLKNLSEIIKIPAK